MGKEKAKILIIESQKDVRSFYNAAIGKMESVEVETAASGEEARKLLQDPTFTDLNIVVLEWDMPDVPGCVLVQNIRQEPRHDLVDIIVRSETLGDEDAFLLAEMDVMRIIKKSDGAGPLISAIETILGQQKKTPPGQNLKVIERSLTHGKLQDVEEAFKSPEFVETLKANPRFVHCVGDFLILKREFENAVSVLNEHLRQQEEPGVGTIKSLSTLGKALCHVGKYDDAISIFDRLAKRSPLNLDHQSDVGDALLGMNKLPEAKEAFSKVLEMDSTNKKGLEGMGKTLIAEGNFEAGKTFFDQIGGQFESYSLASFFNNRAIAIVRSGKPETAINFYEKALPLFEKYKPLIQFNLGMAHLRNNAPDKAADYFEAILKTAEEGSNEDAKNLIHKQTIKEFQKKGREKFIADMQKK